MFPGTEADAGLRLTKEAPEPSIESDGMTFEQAACPVLVTENVTVICCPAFTEAFSAFALAIRFDEVCTMTAVVVAPFVSALSPELKSVPWALIVKLTLPVVAALKRYVKTCEAPLAIEAEAGAGAAACATVAVPFIPAG